MVTNDNLSNCSAPSLHLKQALWSITFVKMTTHFTWRLLNVTCLEHWNQFRFWNLKDCWFLLTCNLKHKLQRKAYAFKTHKHQKNVMSFKESFMIKSLINLSPQFFKSLNWKYNPIAVMVFLVWYSLRCSNEWSLNWIK